MKFMNDFDIQEARSRFTRATKPNRLALVLVIEHLAEWTNDHGDGWANWPAPVIAAAKAITLVESTTNAANDAQEQEDITDEEMLAAVRPIRSFLITHGASISDRELILRAVHS